MAHNKVVFGNQTLMDISGDSVEAKYLLDGVTAHDKNGELVTGTCKYDANTSSGDANATKDTILIETAAYVNGKLVEGQMPNKGSQTLYISDINEPAGIERGYHDGGGFATIADTEKAKLVAGNIKNGITILGVTGSMTGEEDISAGKLNATPALAEKTYTPSAQGYDYFSEVVVAAIPVTTSPTADTTGTTVTIGQV